MEWDPTAQERPPPRHELESDEEDDDKVEAVNVSLEGAITRPLVVLIGAVGASVLVASASASNMFPQHGALLLNGHACGYLHNGGDDASDVLYIARPELLQLHMLTPVAQAIADSGTQRVTIVCSYVPGLYIGRVPSDPPLRYLDSEHSSLPAPYARWDAPNIFTGLEAAVFAACAYRRIPALLIGVPAGRAGPHQSFHWRASESTRVIPSHLHNISPADALAQLARHGEQLASDHARALSSIVSGGSPAAAPKSLLVAAHQATYLTRSADEVGTVGDGSMYV